MYFDSWNLMFCIFEQVWRMGKRHDSTKIPFMSWAKLLRNDICQQAYFSFNDCFAPGVLTYGDSDPNFSYCISRY